ncbi:uncharacterized protein C594.04c-like [Andrographis paniculata]|uniref:uncharacterized protein C594.04c-like n=1 Tax=Andrographis paniculata TaxID=175694 RepID=UPI0021E86FE7|nr:uncharacterized protein C594.04c-like [Andrographis paniculata]XP_051150830.1 uncharacterized protein C594.04c-like [Andrographis paniculata]XP_051150831.1 uncharacterized protein C594.04c-like [Andrographis paniculata]XP_051150832.1 uncharacterized protein C594.04c-like [Andrographis paniculata]XP_051150833.1 uncharacterized protein C594.04c-like [Andrographis paniculata]XP_051150834.1 uncharacterized protein C594.04c-like [Andrographis paniculata]XP_051150835.1 uncharacterized protein C5
MATSNCSSYGGNLPKILVALLAPLPSIIFYLSFLRRYSAAEADSLAVVWNWSYRHPMLLANLLFLLNVNLLFWLLGLLQSSHWMIDLYWTVIPVLLAHFFGNHPLAEYNDLRSRIVIILTWIWSIRLTHSYFRRERWHWGAREDWRFADMRLQYGKNWWWVSFFAVYLSQQVFLMGICFPLYVVHSKDRQLNVWDVIAALVCLSGVTIAYFADTQLHNFVTRNQRLKEIGKALVPTLDEGLWHYSRHPNYFGEQLWWWGLAIFAWNLDCGWAFTGALINSLCLAYVTVLVEDRMLKQQYRADAYKHYKKTTSVWVPWFKTSSAIKDKQT